MPLGALAAENQPKTQNRKVEVVGRRFLEVELGVLRHDAAHVVVKKKEDEQHDCRNDGHENHPRFHFILIVAAHKMHKPTASSCFLRWHGPIAVPRVPSFRNWKALELNVIVVEDRGVTQASQGN